MVLLVLAVVWAAVLIPPALRARQEGRPSDSISNFRRQLAVLRRTGPKTRGSADHWARPYASPSPTLASVSRLHTTQAAGGRPLPYLAPSAADRLPSGARRRRSSPHRPLRRPQPHPPPPARRAHRPRRPGGVSLLLVLVTGLSSMFVLLHVLADILLVAYVALLIHQRNVAAEPGT